ncbi:MAG: hypothetical protein IPK00_23140 [Deltaproteobacteria bacterium]|nr:hypothetical protein [Deltaproteobacteria bacterium]
MRDAIELEWAGVPSLAIIHEAVRGSAESMARLSGFPDYGFILVDYPWIPTAVWTDDEVRTLARRVAPQVIERFVRG